MIQVETNSVYIIDDDKSVREALSLIFDLEGFDAQAFESGDAFMAEIGSLNAACVLLDVHMPGRSGIDILRQLSDENYSAPVFVISGQGDIPMAVAAIKQGAFDFIEKPFDADQIVKQVRDAIERNIAPGPGGDAGNLPNQFPGIEKLTPRELQVMQEIVGGASNKEAGSRLGISSRTIEVHRARIMEKLGARNAADLVRIALQS